MKYVPFNFNELLPGLHPYRTYNLQGYRELIRYTLQMLVGLGRLWLSNSDHAQGIGEGLLGEGGGGVEYTGTAALAPDLHHGYEYLCSDKIWPPMQHPIGWYISIYPSAPLALANLVWLQ